VFNKHAETYWQTYIGKLQDKIPFDGLWLDMNEASNFCDGACYTDQVSPNPVQYKLPYLPCLRNLESKSIALYCIPQGVVMELDAHSLFGTM
jgi:alpha-glucosidase (family GH31 glycosyl hydrolase)